MDKHLIIYTLINSEKLNINLFTFFNLELNLK
jgi:hypothetical protein